MSTPQTRLSGGRRTRHSTGTLGTFAGVFTPSVLTILGIILFLRLGYVVGAAGFARALVIIGIANLISILTSFSLATISTNLRVKGGGDYYLISRTLGVEFGGAIGIVLFAAQSISIAFYAIGFGEAVAAISGSTAPWLPQAVAAAAVGALFVLAWVGADAATRFQFVVMAVLVLALAGFFAGGLPTFSGEIFRTNWTASSDQPFWILFAIFFPAVTGFTQGVSMSGDLKSPSRSLPLGTFLAVGVSVLVYFGVALVLAGAASGSDLVSDYGVMRRISVAPWLIDAGVISATLSSALASFLGAPRILQSLAQDRVFPWLNPFAKGHGASENPRRGVLVSLGIALVTVAVGNLNLIAPVVSMFFLISYGLLNFATYYEARAKSPSFRPTFRWHDARVSLAGALACGAVMLAINPLAGAIAGAILFGILQYLRRAVRVSRWADSGRSLRLQQIRENLAGLAADPEHPRDWRPVILAFSDDPARRSALLRFASWIEGESGFVTAVRILDPSHGPVDAGRLREAEAEIRSDLAGLKSSEFVRSLPGADASAVLPVLIGSHGIGELRANTILVNRLESGIGDDDEERRSHFAGNLRTALRAGCNILVLDAESAELDALDATPLNQRRIDVWYRDDPTGHLALLLAYLTTRTGDWKDAVIRVIAIQRSGLDRQTATSELTTILEEVRIDAEPMILDRMEPASILETSRDASMVFLPFSLRGRRALGPSGEPLATCGRDLPVVAFVLAAKDIDLDAEPEDGAHAEIAEAMDRSEDAATAARDWVKKAEAAEKAAAEIRSKLKQVPEDQAEAKERAQLIDEADRIEHQARAARNAADRLGAEAERARLDAEGSGPGGQKPGGG